MSKYIWIGLGLIGANFIVQAVGAHDWLTAFDRSFFQADALGAVWFADWYAARKVVRS